MDTAWLEAERDSSEAAGTSAEGGTVEGAALEGDVSDVEVSGITMGSEDCKRMAASICWIGSTTSSPIEAACKVA